MLIRTFADQPKEPEMQIGLPTDVKHVAHIGWDGPSAVDPSWVISVFLSHCLKQYIFFYFFLKDKMFMHTCAMATIP